MIRIENLETRLTGFNLHEINLSIEGGEFFILMGPTGAGKTVLLEALAGFRYNVAGSISEVKMSQNFLLKNEM